MEKFLQRWAKSKQSSTSSNANENVDPPSTNPSNSNINTNASEPSLTHSRELEKESNFEQPSSKYRRIEINLENLPAEPGLRPSIYEYHPNDLEQIRKLYLQRGPCQPHFDPETLPYTLINGKKRRFNPDWFKDYPFWLEYSVEKDAVFCLYCYLFKTPNEKFGADAFISDGFRNWKKKEKLEYHVGGPKSAHNIAMEKCQNLLRQEGHIETLIEKKTDQDRTEYRIRLNASFEAVRYLLRQGLAFRGHNESASSKNQGNFIEYLKSLARVSDEIKEAVIENAPKNNKLTSPDIQKDLVNACAVETTKLILEDLGDDYFSILVDESRDVSIKEQMAIILRYVDKQGSIVQRFLAIVHVVDTTSHNLKASIDAVFAKHRLSISKLRGQGYDRASNMRGEFNGLKSLILKENPSAHYIHCFAHQLQLALVGLSKYHPQVDYLFTSVNKIATTVGASARRRDILREAQATKILLY